MLDIGGDVGALVATMDDDTLGTELHLRSETRPPIDIHTGVWRRGSGSEAVTAAVFAELVAGTYWVLDGAGRRDSAGRDPGRRVGLPRSAEKSTNPVAIRRLRDNSAAH